jgi:glycogen(starch) synthase
MRIAFLSYEFPGETGGGGIGTYLKMITDALIRRGHEVIVFCGTSQSTAYWQCNYVYRIPSDGWKSFAKELPAYFFSLHDIKKFDVFEATDFNASGLQLKLQLPSLPMVVRLHTPLYFVDRLLYRPLSFKQKLRFFMGAVKRGEVPHFKAYPKKEDYKDEFSIIKLAERICSPGPSIVNEMQKLGFEMDNKVDIVPLPFINDEVIDMADNRDSRQLHIMFIGRMELRKGVVEIAAAIPIILRKFSTVKFSFIGGDSESPVTGQNMTSYLQSRLKNFKSSVNFKGRLERTEVSLAIKEGDIFIFPSHYESFGLACCEAMAAGKAVIGSLKGGMSEIIEDGKSGLLIEPGSSKLIANSIINLIQNKELRLKLGVGAKKRIASFLDVDNVVNAQLFSYQKAIDTVKMKNI